MQSLGGMVVVVAMVVVVKDGAGWAVDTLEGFERCAVVVLETSGVSEAELVCSTMEVLAQDITKTRTEVRTRSERFMMGNGVLITILPHTPAA